ncbi:hypothetical protein ACIQUL_36090 [Streptomyces sp. NPDC090303]|uniref:hypothetical protein n=1 Tax=Streptomyces sp. NPDC090303 TaxID=3365960 RepID=UPI0038278EEB
MWDDYGNSESAYIDSVLYSDQTADNFTPYGANGFGAAIYSVSSMLDGKETYGYEGTDSTRAEHDAMNLFKRFHGKSEVVISRDGSFWKWVFCIPKAVVPDAKPVLLNHTGCIDPRCGEINPLSCWCKYFMTPDQIERYKQY